MAVYTHIDEKMMAEILRSYDLPPLVSYSGIAAGVSNTNYLLMFPDRKVVLTVLEKGESPEDARFFIELMRHTNAHGLTCPTVYKKTDGQDFFMIGHKPAFLLSFVDGEEAKVITPSICYEAGKGLSRFHRTAATFKHHYANPLHVSILHKRYINPVITDIEKLYPETLSRVRQEFDAVNHTPLPKDLPHGLCFLDYFPDNVFFINDKFAGLIDFYYAGHDVYIYDLMIALNAWCFEKPSMTFKPEKARAFLDGYQSEGLLSNQEYDLLPRMGRLAALRILCSRLYDKIMFEETGNKMHDPLEYDRILCFHLSIKHADEYIS